MYVLIVCLLVFAPISNGQSTDDLLSEIFTKPSSPNRAADAPMAFDRCTKDGHEGECVPFYLCSNDSKVLTGGEGIIDIRFNEGEGECKDYLTTCCFTEDKLAVPRKPENHNTLGCGVRNFEGLGFRIQGAKDMESEFGEFPWMVALLSEEEALGKTVNVYKCGGSLIHPQVVLTGAHCVHGKQASQLKARLGEWDTQTTNELYEHVDITGQKVIVHEGFNPQSLYNNIALVILEQPAKLDNNIDVICLPPQGVKFDGSRCTASGWGKDHFGKEGKYQVILKKIDLPIVEFKQCQESLRSTRLGRYFKLHESFVCAGGEPGKDTCRGDGGSPLICPVQNDPKRFYQVGIVSWGIGCGENGVPGVYANIPLFRNWIDLQLQQNGIDTSSYNY